MITKNEAYWERIARIKEEMLRVAFAENKALTETLAMINPQQSPWREYWEQLLKENEELRAQVKAQTEKQPVPLGSFNELKVAMQNSAWDELIRLDDALRNINDFAQKQLVPQQEPVAYADKIAFENAMKSGKGHDVWPNAGDYEDRTGRKLIALYTTPPQRTWVGLTDDEIDQGLLRSDYAFKTAEAWRAGVVFAMTKLKEKNT